MSEPLSPGIRWRRLVAESVAVVLSILLAFAIDASWDRSQERAHRRDLMAGMLEDFQSSRPGLESRLLLAQRMAAGTAGFLDLAGDGVAGTVVIPDSVLLAAIGAPTYEPATNTLDAALASGEIELVEAKELRTELASWRRKLVDTKEDELEVRRITNEQLVPILAQTIDLVPHFARVLAWSGGDPFAAGRLLPNEGGGEPTPQVSVSVSTELLGALALRRFYVEFAAADLEDLLASLDRSMELLELQLNR